MILERQPKSFEEIDPETDKVAKEVVDAAFQVHKNLGPGLLENAYETCLLYEIIQKGLKVERQVEVPLVYKGVQMNAGFTCTWPSQKGWCAT